MGKDEATGKRARASPRGLAQEKMNAPTRETGELWEHDAFGTVDAYDIANTLEHAARTSGGASVRSTLDADIFGGDENPKEKRAKHIVKWCLGEHPDFSRQPIGLPEELFSKSTTSGHDDEPVNLCRGCRRKLPAAIHFELNKKSCRQCLERQRLKKQRSQHLGARKE